MALTAAEKQKRYREKIKNDPVKYEIQRKNDLARVKKNIKSKKIAEMTEAEKQKQREIWRENKKKRRLKKQEETKKKAEQIALQRRQKKEKQAKVQKVHRNGNRELVRKYNAAVRKIHQLEKLLDRNRKRQERQNRCLLDQLKEMEITVMKMRTREEVLESALTTTYKTSKSRRDKNVLKNVAKQTFVRTNGCVGYVSKLIGLRGRIRKRNSKVPISADLKNDITSFFLREDISRSTAGKKECRTLNKQKKQKRYMTDTLYNLYKTFQKEGGKCSFSTFYKNKPFYVLSPSIINRDTCMCIKHSNTDMLFLALKKNGCLSHQNMTEFISNLVCDRKKRECMYGECEECKTQKVTYNSENVNDSNLTTWTQWERINHQYSKIEKGQQKTFTTKKTVKKSTEGSIETLKKEFEKQIVLYKKHCFNVSHQQQQYREIIQKLASNEVLILCDFSENYSSKMSSEIQAMHFGASKAQITLHCGMVYWSNESQSFCTISDKNSHDPAAIWAHLLPIIKMIKNKTQDVDTIHFYSDGPSSQYRQKKNFYLLTLFRVKLQFHFATWSFFESGHGKGVADGIGASVKRALDRQVSYGADVTNASDAFNVLANCMPSVKCIYVSESDIDNINTLIPCLKPVPNTLQIHQVISSTGLGTSDNEIYYRTLSCFCTKQSVCVCYSPKKHILPRIAPEIFPVRPSSDLHAEPHTSLKTTVREPQQSNPIHQTDSQVQSDCEPDSLPEVTLVEVHHQNTEKRKMKVIMPQKKILRPSSDLHAEPHTSLKTTVCEPQQSNPIHQTDSQVQSDCEPDSLPEVTLVEVHHQNTEKRKMKVIMPHEFISHKYNPELFDTILTIEDDEPAYGYVEAHDYDAEVNESVGKEDSENVKIERIIEKYFPDGSIFEDDCDLLKSHTDCDSFVPDDVQNRGIGSTSEQQENRRPLSDNTNNKSNLPKKRDDEKVGSMPLTKNPGRKRVSTSTKTKEDAKKIKKLSVENKSGAQKSLKTVVSRSLECSKCKTKMHFTSNQLAKCISCKKIFCFTCCAGQTTLDYICDTCLEDGAPED